MVVSDRAKELQKDELAKQNTITWNTENGEPPPADQLAWSDVWKMTKPGDLLTVHKMPCAREGYMTGIVSGAAMGALRLVLGSPIKRAANWGVGFFVVGSVLAYPWCQYQRALERVKVNRMLEVVSEQKAAKKREEEALALAARRKEEEAARSRRWYKFW